MLAIQNDIHSQRKAHFSVPEEVARKYRKKGIVLKALDEETKEKIKLPLTPTIEEMNSIEDTSAGFTYLGQIISHDLTYMLRQKRSYSTSLELHTLYGDSELVPPLLLRKKAFIGEYEAIMDEDSILENAKFRYRQHGVYYDFVRNDEEKAILIDERNDDNFIVGQLLLVFMRFHNMICGHLSTQRIFYSSEQLFVAAKSVVVGYYRWIVVQEYLKKIVNDSKLIDELLATPKNFRIVKSKRPPVIMPEFVDAAFRVGHSQVQNAYKLNNTELPFSIFGETPKKSLNGQADRMVNPIKLEWTFLFDMKDQNVHLQKMAAFNPEFTLAFSSGNPFDLIEIDIRRNTLFGYEFAQQLQFDLLTEKSIEDCIKYFESRTVPLRIELVELKKLPLGIYIRLVAVNNRQNSNFAAKIAHGKFCISQKRTRVASYDRHGQGPIFSFTATF